MSLTATALSADLSASGLTMKVASGTGFPTAGGAPASPGYLVRVDKEFMLAVSQPVAGVIKLAMRGYDGTAAQAHDVLAKVEVSASGADFAGPSPGNSVTLPPYLPVNQTIGEDITFSAADVLAWGNQPRQFVFTKATAATVTLAAPSKGQDGLVLTFTSATALANVVSTTSLLANGDTASPYNTATGTNTKIGATITLQAQNGLYNVVSNTFYTIA